MADKNKIVYNIQVNAEQGNATIRQLNGQIVAGAVPLDQLRTKFGNFAKQVNAVEFNKFNKGLKSATAAKNGLARASGGATTSVLELGRVVSDAPYGIRGMANNVSQLASNMLFTSQQIDKTTGKAIGFSGVLKDMGKVFLGPLGILFAIQAAISALDYFYGAAKKAEKSISDLTSKTYASSLMAKNYVEELENVSISEERRAVVTQELIKLVPTLTEADLKYGQNLDKVRVKINSYALAQASRIEIDNLVQENSQILAAKNELESIKQIENSEERMNRMKKFVLETGEEISGYFLGFGQEGLIKKGDVDATSDEFERLGRIIDKQSKPIITRIDELTTALELDPSKDKKGKKKKRAKVEYFDFKSLQEGSDKIIAEIMRTDEKIALLSAKDKKSRLIIQRDFHLRRLMTVDGANSELINTYKEYYDRLIAIAEEGELELLAREGAGGMAGRPRNTITDAETIRERQRLLTEVKIEALMESSQAIGSFLDAEFQRDITREQNKTNAINNELRERLNNENLSKSERKRIQLEIAKNDEELRKKQEKIEKKRFKTQKAINISQALLSTYLAVAQVQANPLDLNPVTKGISMAATLAMGLANVATLARQKFQSSAGATMTAGALGGGGSDGSRDRSFNFNLAGASRENQLAETLQGRFNQPIQTYVVSRDITNSQQLDEDIRNNASFG